MGDVALGVVDFRDVHAWLKGFAEFAVFLGVKQVAEEIEFVVPSVFFAEMDVFVVGDHRCFV